jgi:hypothetical protein
MMQFDAPSCIFRSRRALVADRGCAGRPVRVLPITEDHTTPHHCRSRNQNAKIVIAWAAHRTIPLEIGTAMYKGRRLI